MCPRVPAASLLEVTNFEDSVKAGQTYDYWQDQTFSQAPKAALLATPGSLGSQAVGLPSTVLWLRNQNLVRIFVSNRTLEDASPALPDQLLEAALAVDQYLSEHAVSPELQARPSSSLRGERSVRLNPGDRAKLKLEGLDDVLEVKAVEMNLSDVVVLVNAATGNTIELASIGEGTVEVTLCVAHKDTLAVKTHEAEIVVGKQGNQDRPESSGENLLAMPDIHPGHRDISSP